MSEGLIPVTHTLVDLCDVVHGKLFEQDAPDAVIYDLLIDSRKVVSPYGTLFFALVTRKNNGHLYLEELVNKGVRNFVISQPWPAHVSVKGCNIIMVPNTLQALQQMSAYHRKKFDIPVIGVTGSNGKTIVKEWLYQLLVTDKKVLRSPKSYNSQVGVPLSVWQMKPGYEIAVFEAGISEPDEMDKLQSIIKPTIGIFTNIGPAHSENFINQGQKVGEKLKLFTHVKQLIYCLDHKEVHQRVISSGLCQNVPVLTWGVHQDANLCILNSEIVGSKTLIRARFEQREIHIEIPFSDRASLENVMHCWALLLLLGYTDEDIAGRMLHLQAIAMRLELKEGVNNCTVINDSYNSDFNSLSIAIDFIIQQQQNEKRTIILSDILQSGMDEEELYCNIAKLLERKEIHKIIGIGPSICRQAQCFNIEKEFYASTDDFLRSFVFSSLNNETILLKGARRFEFERIDKMLQRKAHETVMEVNLSALLHNYNYFRSIIAPGTRLMAMVKAFSYGSGSYEIANILQYHHVDYLTVAYADEGVELRRNGITTPIMVMNPEAESFDTLIRYDLEPEIYSFEVLEKLQETIQNMLLPENKPVKIHIKLDTGMHRLGFEEQDIPGLLTIVSANSMVYVQSVFSHLAGSDSAEHDAFTQSQIDRFTHMSDEVCKSVKHPVWRHILNSAGISRFPGAQFDMVRLGISLYGVAVDEAVRSHLQPVSALYSSVSQVKHVLKGDTIGYSRVALAHRDMNIAVVPIGYADGLSRRLSNGIGYLMIKGERVPVVGNICMDMCMVDVTGLDVHAGDKAVVFGPGAPIEWLAKALATIPYEVLTSVSRRVKRVYFQE